MRLISSPSRKRFYGEGDKQSNLIRVHTGPYGSIWVHMGPCKMVSNPLLPSPLRPDKARQGPNSSWRPPNGARQGPTRPFGAQSLAKKIKKPLKSGLLCYCGAIRCGYSFRPLLRNAGKEAKRLIVIVSLYLFITARRAS